MDKWKDKLLTAQEEVELAKLAAKGDVAARDRMILSNERLVYKIALRYQGVKIDFEDLIQEGHLGLVHAIRKFDPKKGFRFSTYATIWIRQYIQKYIAMTSGNIRSKGAIFWQTRRYAVVVDQMRSDLGRYPTDNEIAKEMGVRPSVLVSIKKAVIANDRAGYGSVDVAKSHERLPQEVCEENEMIARVADSLRYLDERSKDIIRMRFGIGTNQVTTLMDIGKKYGLSRERVRQVERNALEKLNIILSI